MVCPGTMGGDVHEVLVPFGRDGFDIWKLRIFPVGSGGNVVQAGIFHLISLVQTPSFPQYFPTSP